MDTIEINGRTFNVDIVTDDSHGAPWQEEAGHGPVTDWTRSAKRPGEVAIASDRGFHRYYDFQEACQIARRDGWGWLPGRLVVDRFAHSGAHKWRARVERRPDLVAYGRDQNVAIATLYAMHRATMSPKAYAAGAALCDMDRMRGWCDGTWCYVGVVVTREDTGASESLWGIESDAEDYLEEVARDLAHEIIAAEQAAS